MSENEIRRLLKNWRPWDYLRGGCRKKDLKPDEIFILKGLSTQEVFRSFLNHPWDGLMVILKQPTQTFKIGLHGIKREFKKLLGTHQF